MIWLWRPNWRHPLTLMGLLLPSALGATSSNDRQHVTTSRWVSHSLHPLMLLWPHMSPPPRTGSQRTTFAALGGSEAWPWSFCSTPWEAPGKREGERTWLPGENGQRAALCTGSQGLSVCNRQEEGDLKLTSLMLLAEGLANKFRWKMKTPAH